MKKRIFTFFFSVLLIAAAVTLGSCEGDAKPEEKEYTAEVKYTVTYSSLVGDVPAVFQVKPNTKITEDQLPVLFAEGYNFEGWYIGNELVTEGYVITKNITIIAKWTPKNFVLKFDANSGSGVTESQTYTYNVLQAIKASNFTAPIGYYFYCWNTEADDSGKRYFPGDKITLSDNLTLYAIYVEKGMHGITYVSSVEFENNNPASYKESADFVIQNPANVTGYIFDGWYETSDFSSEKITGWSKGTKAENIVLYAKWNPVKFKVTFNANYGIGSTESQNFEYGVPQILNANAFTRKGYTFKNWNTKWDGSGTSYSNEVLAVINSVSDVTLYAQWETITYTISYITNDRNISEESDKYTVESDSFYLCTPWRTGYTFAGWYLNPDFTGDKCIEIPHGSTENVIVYAKWDVKTYKVTFMPNGGEGASYTQEFTYEDYKKLTPVAFTKLGYNFVRWDTSSDGTGFSYGDEKYYKVDTYSPSDITLYAIWSIDTYYITYEFLTDDPLVSNDPRNPQSFKVDDEPFFAFDAKRAGYTFAGWYKKYDEETETFSDRLWLAEAIDPAKNTNNITLYAKWIPNTTTPYLCKIMLETLDGTYESYSSNYGFGTTDTKAEPIEPWLSLSGFHNAGCDDVIIKGDGSTVLNMYYDREIIVYKFVLGGGHFELPCSVKDKMIVGKYGQPITVVDPVLDGAYFNGWVSDYDEQTYDSDEITALGLENITFTAEWTKASIINITMGALNDITVVQDVDGNQVTLTATEGYDVYEWSDSYTMYSEISNSLVIDTTGMIPGVHEYFVEAYNLDDDDCEIENSRRSAIIYVEVQ